jgi:AcrR family transcriptional regulator
MAHKPTDPRILRTDRLIQDAFIDLTSELGFDEVTIGEIANRARVNRATFYRHYQDKYDLLEQIFQEGMSEFASDLGPPGEEAMPIDPLTPPERWVKLFEYFATHEQIYRPLLGSKGSSWFVARVRDYFVKRMDEREQQRAHLPAFQGKTLESRIPKKVTLTLASNMLISTIAWWLENGKQYSSKEIATWFLSFTINGYVHELGL